MRSKVKIIKSIRRTGDHWLLLDSQKFEWRVSFINSLFQDILDSLTTDTVIIKIDVEGSECVVISFLTLILFTQGDGVPGTPPLTFFEDNSKSIRLRLFKFFNFSNYHMPLTWSGAFTQTAWVLRHNWLNVYSDEL